MKRKTKIWLFIAAALVLGGCILFAGVMTTLGWDFTKLSTVKYGTNVHEISDTFQKIAIHTDTADIVFALSEDGKCRVECHEAEKERHSVTVSENTLTIRASNDKAVRFGISFDSPKITIYLPWAAYDSLFIEESTGDIEIPKDFQFGNVDICADTGDVRFCASTSEMLKIKTSTGDIRVEHISVGALDLTATTGDIALTSVTSPGDASIDVSTGEVNLADVLCKNLISNGDTGDILLKNTVVTEKISIEIDTGDVRFEMSDAAEIFVKTDTGDVQGVLLTDKIFLVETNTGRKEVPSSTTGGRCEITTDTGDIRISISGN